MIWLEDLMEESFFSDTLLVCLVKPGRIKEVRKKALAATECFTNTAPTLGLDRKRNIRERSIKF